jgi:regulator of CtrA degradation
MVTALARRFDSGLAPASETMPVTADLSPTIVESLYCEALVLADEARAAFDLSGRLDLAGEDEDLARVALSCEALRTTTRMMHAIAWLLNQRAYFAGELSEFQLRQHGRLPESQPPSSEEQLEMLGPDTQALIRRTERFHARIARLDRAWRNHFAMYPSAIHRLRERLGREMGAL